MLDVADETDVGGDAVDRDTSAHGGEEVRVLAGHADGVWAMRVDQVDQFPADLTEQHHPDDLQHFGRRHPEAALEITLRYQDV